MKVLFYRILIDFRKNVAILDGSKTSPFRPSGKSEMQMMMMMMMMMMSMDHWRNGTDRGKPKYSDKTCARATLSTTNLTWNGLGMNPDIRI